MRYIAVPHSVDQNEPSKPHSSLIEANDHDSLVAIVKSLWPLYFDSAGSDPFSGWYLTALGSNSRFGDIYAGNEDFGFYLTKVTDE